MLEIKNLSISYGNNLVLDQVNFQAYPGITCLIGHSGSGKSSLLNACMFQVPFECDLFKLNGNDVYQLSEKKKNAVIRTKYAYFIQGENFIKDISCYENIRLYASFAGKKCTDEQIEKYLNLVNLEIDKKTMPDNLSGGEKQRLALAQALAKETEVILCDEMTASLDPSIKKEIMALLREIADDYHRIIIMSTHDEDVYDYCDQIYEIEDKKLKLIKFNKSNQEMTTELVYKRKLVPKELLRNYNSRKVDRQYGMFILYSIISAMVVAISSFLIYFSYDYISSQKYFLSNQSNTELYVINQTIQNSIDMVTYSFYEDNQPFNESIENELKSIEHVKSVYPFYMGTLMGERRDVRGPEYKEISLVSNQKETIVASIESHPQFPSFFPYYEEQHYENEFVILNEDAIDFGAYINMYMVQELGFNEESLEDLKGYSLKTTMYLPIGCFIKEAYLDLGEEGMVPVDSYQPVMRPVEVEIPIIGVVPMSYTEILGSPNIYLPYDYIEKLRLEVSKNVDLAEDEYSWNENTYIVFAEDSKYLDQINMEVKAIDSQITSGSTYVNIKAYHETTRYIIYTAIVALVLVLLAGSTLSYAYGIFYYQKNQNDVIYFKRSGFVQEEWANLLKNDIMNQAIVVSLIGIPLAYAINYLVKDILFFNMIQSVLSIRFLSVSLCVILLAIIQTYLSRLYYYRKVIKK